MKKKIILDNIEFDKKLNAIGVAVKEFDNFTGFDAISKSNVDNIIYDLPFTIFCKYCYLTLHPQSYGSKFQEKFRREYGLIKVASKLKSGDMKKNLENIEYKVSIIDNRNPTINIVQLQRPRHNVNSYIVQIIDARNVEVCNLLTTWYLSKDQMKIECGLAGNNSAHGDEGLAGLRIDFDVYSESFNRFENKYPFNKFII